MCKVAVIGYGVVGSGTVELFMKNRESISKKVGKECDIKYILDLRDFPDSPFADKMIKDFNIILNDAEVEVVAEVVGGTTFAYDYTKKLLEHGKSVVTSNKALVAEKGAELLKIARKQLQLSVRGKRWRRYTYHQTFEQVLGRKRDTSDIRYSQRHNKLHSYKDDKRADVI